VITRIRVTMALLPPPITLGEDFIMKKLVSLLLALVLVFAMSSVAMADGDLFQIGDNTYATWNEAYAAANDGDTITLLNDVTLPYKEANNVKPPYGIEKNIYL